MKNRLIAEIRTIRDDQSILNMNEASVINQIILKLLSMLSWDIHNTNEVRPEYAIGSKAVDFSLRINGISSVLVEAKAASVNLVPHQAQLLDYAWREGVNLCILTNGIEWWFYLAFKQVRLDQRCFYNANLLIDGPESLADNFISLLSKKM